jgi:hypothetical protein
MSNSTARDEAHRGGTLEEMSARGGTSIPKESGTQPVAHSEPSRRHISGSTAVDNVKPMPESVDDNNGLTGEVRTGMGDALPPGVEAKSIGMDTHGGKEVGAGHHTKKGDYAAAMGRPGRSRDDRGQEDMDGT